MSILEGKMMSLNETLSADGVILNGEISKQYEAVFTPGAIHFVAQLQRRFNKKRLEILGRREDVQERLDAGVRPDFLSETKDLRSADWKVAPIPSDLADRRVEITGPVSRKMVINALNSGAYTYMADFEDSHSPRWQETLDGQVNLYDAINRAIDFTTPDGKSYALNKNTATLLVRPRGWHLNEKHMTVDGTVVSASLFDFGIFFFNNAKRLMEKGSGPYFYLPKLENHLEARLWNDVFVFSQKEIGLPIGTIRATVLIETILAVFEMHEILYELKDHAGGLNCGRWDYIFSFIKKFRNDPTFVLPDRAQVHMNVHFLRSYSKLLIQTCHRRGIHAMGGMAAQIPIKSDPEANQQALKLVEKDKLREVKDGHDGTWVAHPGLVPVALEIFNTHMNSPNQIGRLSNNETILAEDLLAVPKGEITEHGLRTNVNVGLRYLEAWLRGVGCVPLYNLMEDAATAEISRAQLWQWIRHGAQLNTGEVVTDRMFHSVLAEEVGKIKKLVGEATFEQGKFALATELYDKLITADTFESFLTTKAYTFL